MHVPWNGKWFIGNNFYNGLLYSTRMTLDAAIGGTLMNNLQDRAYNLIEDTEKNHHSWGSTQEKIVKAPQKVGLYEVSMFDHMYTKVDALYQKIENLGNIICSRTCIFCISCHPNGTPM